MNEFAVVVRSAGRYNIMGDAGSQQIPVTVKWDGKEIKAYLDADEYDAEDLRSTGWAEVARFVAEHITTRYMYHGDTKAAKELLEWLDDDPEDEHLIQIEEAEQEWLVPRAIASVRQALGPLTGENSARVLGAVTRR